MLILISFNYPEKNSYLALLIIISSHCADTADVTENLDILSEIRILKQAGQHRNVVTFIGACINSGKCWWGRNFVDSNLCSEASLRHTEAHKGHAAN